ncbi:MAG TPA: hypothetical protein VJV78_02670 [Polyangiales bacterium]|nr:hypothetical protein [Polyangiales bacterium]
MSRDVWLALSWAGLCFVCVLIAGFGTDAGITYDEKLQVEYGDLILEWYRSGFVNSSALHFHNLYLYGGLFDAFAQLLSLLSPLGVYDTRHILTACVAAMGLVATWQLAATLGGSRAGFIGATLLLLTPTWTGHGLFNPKDIPFGTAAAFAMVMTMRVLVSSEGLSGRNTALAGVALGTALAVRPGGVFLLFFFLAAVTIRCLLEKYAKPVAVLTQSRQPHAVRRVIAVMMIAWALMLLAWPWGQVSPILHPLRAVAAAAHFDFKGLVLFDGRLFPAKSLPARYLPVWCSITLPETYLAALAAAAYLAVRTTNEGSCDPRKRAALLLLCAAIATPFALAVTGHLVLYDAYRHVLFVLPWIAALAAYALTRFFAVARRLEKHVMLAACFATSMTTAAAMVRLHPYEYVYFNPIFGGLPAAAQRYETDYWGASYYEGLKWVIDEAKAKSRSKVRIGWCTDWIPLDYYVHDDRNAQPRVELTNAHKPDYYLYIDRYMCTRRLPHGRLAHAVKREGVPLLYILDLRQGLVSAPEHAN